MVANFLMRLDRKGVRLRVGAKHRPGRSLHGINISERCLAYPLREFENDARDIGDNLRSIVTHMPARACSEKFHRRNSHKRHTTDSHHDIFE
jgi:hypothetical protein